MPQSYILAIDQGTTGSRAIIYDRNGSIKASSYQEFKQYFPQHGWVEHDAHEILRSVQDVIAGAIRSAGISAKFIHAIGLTNQRETTILWNRKTGRAISRAIVWQDRRTHSICQQLKKKNLEKTVHHKTGLVLDPYFSGTKLKWLFDRRPADLKKARRGDVVFGTIDSWLLFHLTAGKSHATDYTNASRTLIFNIKRKKWDLDLCQLLNVPKNCLPEAKPSNSLFGTTKNFLPLKNGIPIHAILGDQQAALYGQSCYKAGESKNTYGTGCFLLVNLGSRLIYSSAGLLTTLACDQKGNPTYALEGAIFIGGAAVQWLRDGLKLIKTAKESEKMALRAGDAGPLVVVPAFTGLGAPYWRSDVRGAIFGITRGTSREMIVKATLDSIALQVSDVLNVVKQDSKIKIPSLKVDGGATRNKYLMQLQANLLGTSVCRSSLSELTAWGAAKLAGYSSGFWKRLKSLDSGIHYDVFRPKMSSKERSHRHELWHQAIKKLIS